MILLAYGVPGSGKSTLLHDYVRFHAHAMRFFVSDHEAGWGSEEAGDAETPASWRGKPPPIRIFYKDKGGLPHEWPETGVFVFRNFEPDEVAQLAMAVGDVYYVDDELDRTARRQGFDKGALRRIVHEGRHLPNRDGEICEVSILGACRRPQNLHTDVTELADQVFVFRVQGMRTLERLVNDSIIWPKAWNKIRSLPRFHFLHWPSGKFDSVAPVGAPEPFPNPPDIDDEE